MPMFLAAQCLPVLIGVRPFFETLLRSICVVIRLLVGVVANGGSDTVCTENVHMYELVKKPIPLPHLMT
jgi:uncharacterized membrane protein